VCKWASFIVSTIIVIGILVGCLIYFDIMPGHGIQQEGMKIVLITFLTSTIEDIQYGVT